MYVNFRMYQEQRDHLDRSTLEDFATNAVSHETTALRSLLWQIHKLVVPNSKESAPAFSLVQNAKSISASSTQETIRSQRSQHWFSLDTFQMLYNYISVGSSFFSFVCCSDIELLFKLSFGNCFCSVFYLSTI